MVVPNNVVRREYPNPPIEEGLCQFTFSRPLGEDLITPGRFFDRIRGEYPQQPQQQSQVQASLAPESEGSGQAAFKLDQAPFRILFRNAQGTRLLTLGRQTLSANSRRPYEGWPSLEERLQSACQRLSEAVEDLPPITTVALRYINRIVIPELGFDTERYFSIAVRAAQDDSATLNQFLIRTESLLADNSTKANITFATVEAPLGSSAMLFDLEFVREFEPGWSVADAMGIARELKLLENAEFEANLTDESRGLFE